ncbi:MAG: hypothetical protein L0228_08955 [Planctomycetes bacterium]|nr:hypothetical protein [Planctomycetota bacterium]
MCPFSGPTVHGQFIPGQQATSALLEGFAVDAAALFAVAEDIPDEETIRD